MREESFEMPRAHIIWVFNDVFDLVNQICRISFIGAMFCLVFSPIFVVAEESRSFPSR